MSDWLGILAALAVFVLPLALAWWLLGRRQRPPRAKEPVPREKMPR